MNFKALCGALLLLAGARSTLATPHLPASQPQLEPRAMAAFDRAIKHYKSFKSLFVMGDESIVGGAKPSYLSVAASLELPWRAKIDLATVSEPSASTGHLLTRRLLGKSSYIEWNDGAGETRTPLKTGADRERALAKMFLPDPLFALGVFTLANGTNPAKTPYVQSATFSIERVKIPTYGTSQELQRVRVVRQEPGDPQPIILDYFFTLKTSDLARFVITRVIAGKKFVATFDDFIAPSDNSFHDQDADDRYVYDWEAPPQPAPKRP